MKKQLTFLTALLMLATTATACGDGSSSQNIEDDFVKDFDISNIDWSVDEADLYGTNALSLSYTNNTDYTIAELTIEFHQRDDVTDAERSVFDEWKETYDDWTEEDIADIYMTGRNSKIADPGESVGDAPCTINNLQPYMTSMEQYELMEPTEATIVVLGDNKAYAFYYDFSEDTCTDSGYGSIDTYEWQDCELAAMIPEPTDLPLLNSSESDDKVSFEGYGASEEIFENYISECKDMGYTIDMSEGGEQPNSYFTAENASGYELRVEYDAIDEKMSGRVCAPDEDEEDDEEDNSNYISEESTEETVTTTTVTTTDSIETETETETETDAETPTDSASSDEIAALNETISADISETIGSLNVEYNALLARIDSYDDFVANVADVETLYTNVYDKTYNLCIRMKEYSISYAENVLSSGASIDDMNDSWDEFYDDIYDGALDDIYDGIYEGLLDEIYDSFYNGVLSDAPDSVDYSDWISAYTDEYDRWLSCDMDVYDYWLDTDMDIYDFYLDISSAFWSDDLDEAYTVLESFRADVDSLNSES